MSSLSGFDSEAVGFESVAQSKREETTASTQTCEWGETGVGSQTVMSKECGSLASPEELNAGNDLLKEYPPPGLNAFLRRVVPGMLEQLEQKDREGVCSSSDSEEEEVLRAELVQEGRVDVDGLGLGSGDHQSASILSLSWSASGRLLAAGVGQPQHETWCTHEAVVRVSGRGLRSAGDLAADSCVTVVLFHPSVASLLAFGTSSGSVVVCSLDTSEGHLATPGGRLTSPEGAHGTRRVAALHWADPPLTSALLAAQIQNTGKRRGASDQILISAGANGSINVWQVNVNLRILELVSSHTLTGYGKEPASDVTCFDFIKSYPLRPCDEKVSEDTFVVGTSTGQLFVCALDAGAGAGGARGVLGAHGACVARVTFSTQRAGVLASLDARELRVHRLDSPKPLKVYCLDEPASCMAWLPNSPCVIVLGLANPDKQQVRLFDVCGGRRVPVEGLAGCDAATAVAVDQGDSCRIACGDAACGVRVWELPARRVRLSHALDL